jgi:N-acyl homoserine lactone hydrolase
VAAGVRRIVLLTLGWEDLPKSVSVEGAPDTECLREPVPGVLLECDGGWLLLDTGFNVALITDPSLRRRFHGDPLIQPVLPGPGEPLEAALAEAGVDLAGIAAVAVSHLHNDHAGGLKHFAGRVPVHIQRAELDYGMSAPPGPEDNGIFRVDFDDPRIDWRLADGDTEIAPGVSAVLTAGHTPGHQSFVVSVDERAGGGGWQAARPCAGAARAFTRRRLREPLGPAVRLGSCRRPG